MNELQELLAEHYDIPPTTAPVEIADGVYRHGNVAIKRNPFARREADILVTLEGGTGYRVQTLVRTTRGEVAVPGVLVTRWEEGTQKTYRDITEPEWRALGAELAAMHERLDTHTGEVVRMPLRLVDIAQHQELIANHRLRDNPLVAQYLDTQLGLLERVGERAMQPAPVGDGPIHNDYNQYNYLFDGTLPPIILDWEGALIAPREYEVVRCLNHLPLVAPEHAQAFVDGYRSRRPLDRAGLRWGIDRALLDHALKIWPLERPSMLPRSMEVLTALTNGIPDIVRFFGVEDL